MTTEPTSLNFIQNINVSYEGLKNVNVSYEGLKNVNVVYEGLKNINVSYEGLKNVTLMNNFFKMVRLIDSHFFLISKKRFRTTRFSTVNDAHVHRNYLAKLWRTLSCVFEGEMLTSIIFGSEKIVFSIVVAADHIELKIPMKLSSLLDRERDRRGILRFDGDRFDTGIRRHFVSALVQALNGQSDRDSLVLVQVVEDEHFEVGGFAADNGEGQVEHREKGPEHTKLCKLTVSFSTCKIQFAKNIFSKFTLDASFVIPRPTSLFMLNAEHTQLRKKE